MSRPDIVVPSTMTWGAAETLAARSPPIKLISCIMGDNETLSLGGFCMIHTVVQCS